MRKTKMKVEELLEQNWPFEVRPLDEDEGGGVYVRFTDFPPGSAHGHGADLAEALASARIGLKLTLEGYLEQGLPVPQPGRGVDMTYSGRFNLRTPKSLHRQLAEQAKREGVSLNTLAVSLLSEGLARRQANATLAQEPEHLAHRR
ncbi:MAG TPA: toxin-antitoxin system HicB family antitoxin [Meiothermus sp.]|nr:toxin-antitoxin system HicB family antitoxin [Meiothermus sp.]